MALNLILILMEDSESSPDLQVGAIENVALKYNKYHVPD